jgi:hypothetical protein
VFDRTPAERLDHALDGLLATPSAPPQAAVVAAAAGDGELRPLLVTAHRLRSALATIPVSPAFEARLASRLALYGRRPAVRADGLRIPGWVLLTGAVSSAAVGVGVTAYAVWRGSRRTGVRRMASR